MKQSFIHERYRLDGDSIIISDSDEDNVVENFTTASLDRRAFVTDKNYDGDFYILANSTPKRWVFRQRLLFHRSQIPMTLLRENDLCSHLWQRNRWQYRHKNIFIIFLYIQKIFLTFKHLFIRENQYWRFVRYTRMCFQSLIRISLNSIPIYIFFVQKWYWKKKNSQWNYISQIYYLISTKLWHRNTLWFQLVNFSNQ